MTEIASPQPPPSAVPSDDNPPSFESIVGVQDFDANGDTIVLTGKKIDENDRNGPCFAKNYLSCPQIFANKQVLALSDCAGYKNYFGNASMTHTESESIFERFKVPFQLFFHDAAVCPSCNKVGTTKFVDCAAQIAERYGHFCHNLTGWNEIKCQYYCESCAKYSVFVERKFVFIQTGYYELEARPFNTRDLVAALDSEEKWRLATPDYWTGLKKDDRKTWNGNCFCCGSMTDMVRGSAEGHVSGSGRSSSLHGATFCRKCNLKYHAAEHD